MWHWNDWPGGVAWLMLIASDWQTWLVAALIAVAAAVLARSPAAPR